MEVSAAGKPVPKTKIYVTISAALLAFLAYSTAYAFRKPFTVATFQGISLWGISYQTLLIVSQVFGYMLSKFAGIKLIAELKSRGRFRTVLTLIGTAWICLLVFAFAPPLVGLLCLFINGFALGFLWGVVFSYIEGRQATDLIGSVLAVSFIFASGFTRSVAKWLMLTYDVSERWMPFITGLIFILPLIVLFRALDKVPPPDIQDTNERGKRKPLDAAGRKKLIKEFGPGLLIISFTYFFLTILRDIRDNYMSNIWVELGYGKNYSILTRTEAITSLVVLLIMAMLVLVRKNMKAFSLVHWVIAAGFLMAIISTVLFNAGNISGASWMQFVGMGLYLAYIPFNCIFFERMIASFRIPGNVGFLIYLADSFGYLGSVSVMLAKEFMTVNLSWSKFYSSGVVFGSAIGLAGISISYFYFTRKYRQLKPLENEPASSVSK